MPCQAPELKLCKSDCRKHFSDMRRNQLINKKAVIKQIEELFPHHKAHIGGNACYSNVCFEKEKYVVLVFFFIITLIQFLK